ncbi:MAG: hypothetical protein ACKVP2_12155 [Burkholderiales bacterium]
MTAVRQLISIVCGALIVLLANVLQAAEAPQVATIENRLPVTSGVPALDARVVLLSVDGVSVDEAAARNRVVPGRHQIKVLCASRVFAGMGAVELPVTVDMTIDVAAGEVWRLDAELSAQGDCRPTLARR